MIRLSHMLLKSKIAEQNMTQEAVAEKLGISDRHVRNLCTKDMDTKLSLCYKISKLFGTAMEDLLIVQNADE